MIVVLSKVGLCQEADVIVSDNVQVFLDHQIECDGDDFSQDEGGSRIVEDFLYFLNQVIHETVPDFHFSDTRELSQDTFDEIESLHLRNQLTEFTNKTFAYWRDNWIEVPSWDSTRSNCREYCEGCETEGAWTYPEYEGPDPDNEDEYEDEEDPDHTPAQRLEVKRSNERRRIQLQRGRDDWESDRSPEFTCNSDCDAFCEHISEVFDENTRTDTSALRRAWTTFLREKGCSGLPEPAAAATAEIAPPEALPPAYNPPLVNIRSLLRRARNWS